MFGVLFFISYSLLCVVIWILITFGCFTSFGVAGLIVSGLLLVLIGCCYWCDLNFRLIYLGLVLA